MRCSLALVLVSVVVAACGGRSHMTREPVRSATPVAPAARPAAPSRLALVSTRRLPFAVQLPAAAMRGSQVLAAGGLDAADASLATLVRIAPGRPRTVLNLPQAIHDAGAATLGATVYVFGGGTAAGPTDAIVAIHDGRARTIGHLPRPASDLEAMTVGRRIVVIGGYTATTPLRDVLAFAPGERVRRIAMLPHALRYAAAAVVGGRILIAGGTDGVQARDEILSVDANSGGVHRIGYLPSPLAHAAGTALAGTFYVFGGRGDGPSSQRRTIYGIDPATGRIRHAGQLPAALSDMAAVATGRHVLLIGGRDATGRVQDRLLEYAPRAHAAAARPSRVPVVQPGRVPALLDRRNVYAAGRPNALAPQVRHDPARVYVPNSKSDTVDVISQRSGRVIAHFRTGGLPQHVAPSWDLRTLWVTNDTGNSLTPVDPRTSRPGRRVRVLDPYNLYFAADGRRAIVVAEAHRELDFREPHTMRLMHALRVPTCNGVDHMDFTADGRFALVSCEFAGRLIVVDLRRERAARTIPLKRGAMPQDVKLAPDGRTFYVADMASNGVWLIDPRDWRKIRFQPTGKGAHGLYPSRDAHRLFVTNRDEGTITVLSFKTRRPLLKWRIPGGGSPDMGGVSADGRVLWLSGRYGGEVYALSTRTGRLLRRVKVGSGPHGLCVWPQPGRYSIGHTGILR